MRTPRRAAPMTQRQLRAAHGDMVRREREVRRILADVRDMREDGYEPARQFADACKFSPEFLALPRYYERFQELYSDHIATHRPLGDD